MLQEFSNTFKRPERALSIGQHEIAAGKAQIRLGLFSCGLGSINRGFEISTARFFKAISSCPELDARLYAGSDYPGAQKVWCLNRNQWLSWPLKPLSFLENQRLWKLAYILEQTSYSIGLIREAQKSWQPDLVWTKEVPLAHVLYEFRRLSGSQYKIIFANGGGFSPKTYQQFDFIQHLNPEAYDEAVKFGIDKRKMTVIPNVVPHLEASAPREQLRQEFGYENDDFIVISVAAWNKHHKRLDYLIEEIAQINDPKVKILICGQPEPEGEELQLLARQRLGARARFLTVEENRVQDLLALSDVFVLCSLYEGLGAVMIEAALAGLPVICHPHGGSRYILRDEQWLLDLSKSGNLAARLKEWRHNPPQKILVDELKNSVAYRFSESKIKADFQEMVHLVYKNDFRNCLI